MKKRRILKLTSVILALFMLVSCTPSADSEFIPERFYNLSETRINEISACVQKDNYEYQKRQYFGTYNDYDIVLISEIDGKEYRDAQLVRIAEFDYYIGDTEKIVAYKDNSYILLSEAYKLRIVTKADVKNIIYLFNEYDFSICNDKICVEVAIDNNNPEKKYTADDFPTVKVKEVQQSQWSVFDTWQLITIILPIKNRRHTINVAKKLEGQDNVLSAKACTRGVFFNTSMN